VNEPSNHQAAESPLAALESWLRGLIREEVLASNGDTEDKARGEIVPPGANWGEVL